MEDEQIEKLKTFWNKFGGLITTLAVVLAIAVVGFRVYKDNQRKEAVLASQLFSEILTTSQTLNQQRNALQLQSMTADEENKENTQAIEAVSKLEKTLVQLSNQMKENHSKSIYDEYTVLLHVRALVDQGDIEDAALKLEALAGASKHSFIRDLTRQRLAKLYIQLKEYDKAIGVLQSPFSEAFAAQSNEILGDAYVLKGEADQAVISYSKVVEMLGEDSQQSQFAIWKMNDIKNKSLYLSDVVGSDGVLTDLEDSEASASDAVTMDTLSIDVEKQDNDAVESSPSQNKQAAQTE